MRCWATIGVVAATSAALRPAGTQGGRMPALTVARAPATTARKQTLGSVETTRTRVVETSDSAATTHTPAVATWASADRTSAVVGPTPAVEISGSEKRRCDRGG